MPKPIENLTSSEKTMVLDSIGATALADAATLSMFQTPSFEGLSAPTEYVDTIALVDSLVLGLGAKKDNLGVASDGATPVYSYTIGSGPRGIFLSAGQHSGEPLGMLAAIRVFEWIAKATHPLARRIKASYKVVMVPNLNPWAFKAAGGGRVNFNGVNLNRNYDFFWSQYVDADVTNAKGSAAFSENEAKIVKALFEANDFRISIDCHNMGAAPANTNKDIIQVGAPSSWVHHNRTPIFGAMAAWEHATGGVAVDFGEGSVGEPTLFNWASYYMGVVRGRRDCLATIIECYSDMGGGNPRLLTDAGAGLFCGMILSLIREHMAVGHRPDRPSGYDLFVHRANTDPATSVGAGGTLIDVSAATPIQFDSAYGLTLANGDRIVGRDVAAPSRGYWALHGDVYLESSGTTEQRIDLAISNDGVASGNFVVSTTVPATAGARVAVPIQGFIQVTTPPDAKTIKRFGLLIQKNGTITANNPKLIRARLRITWVPFDTYNAPMPLLPRGV